MAHELACFEQQTLRKVLVLPLPLLLHLPSRHVTRTHLRLLLHLTLVELLHVDQHAKASFVVAGEDLRGERRKGLAALVARIVVRIHERLDELLHFVLVE